MKKTLEDELMSLAHRILKLRGREDIEELRDAAGMLYDKLTILSFTEKHFSGPQPTIGKASVLEALEKADKQEDNTEEKEKDLTLSPDTDKKDDGHQEELVAESPNVKEEKTDDTEEAVQEISPTQSEEKPRPIIEDISKKEAVQPNVEQKSKEVPPLKKEEIEPPTQEKPEETPAMEKETLPPVASISEDIDFREIAVHYDDLPQFDPIQPSLKKHEENLPLTTHQETKKTEPPKSSTFEKPAVSHNPNLFSSMDSPKTRNDPKFHKRSINESLNMGLNIGLNDQHAFIKNLFEGNSTDFKRVISQLSTFESYEEAKVFIEEQVKPDYDWENKTEYEERFFTTIEKKMNH